MSAIETPISAPVPSATVIAHNPAYDEWVERVAIDYCTAIDRDHEPDARPCLDCLRWAREMAARACYECGIAVLDNQGEKQGRAGWVHYDCCEDDNGLCGICDEDVSGGGSHYHCGRCNDPKPTSMYGHYVLFTDGTRGFACDKENLGKEWAAIRGRFVTEADLRPKGQVSDDVY